tara:strand:- start:352 stop:528 length:177 start_codon:yes stop_codon:yes gene_type:complete
MNEITLEKSEGNQLVKVDLRKAGQESTIQNSNGPIRHVQTNKTPLGQAPKYSKVAGDL